MAATASAELHFDQVPARLVGEAGFYLSRPGFWHGGIAACWLGATCAVAETLWDVARAASEQGWHHLLALGEADRLLVANAAFLREAAAWVDHHPRRDAREWALRTRAASDECAQQVLRAASRAVGAGPLCRNEHFARLAADLPVFVRQCHGDRDLAGLGALVATSEQVPWTL